MHPNINGIQFSIGRMEAQKHTALHDLHVANEAIVLLQQTLIKDNIDELKYE